LILLISPGVGAKKRGKSCPWWTIHRGKVRKANQNVWERRDGGGRNRVKTLELTTKVTERKRKVQNWGEKDLAGREEALTGPDRKLGPYLKRKPRPHTIKHEQKNLKGALSMWWLPGGLFNFAIGGEKKKGELFCQNTCTSQEISRKNHIKCKTRIGLV